MSRASDPEVAFRERINCENATMFAHAHTERVQLFASILGTLACPETLPARRRIWAEVNDEPGRVVPMVKSD